MIKLDWVTLRIRGLFDDFMHQREQGEGPGTTSWNLSSGWGLRACSWHEQSIAILSRACSFLLYFPMHTKAIFGDIQSYSVLDFPSTKYALNG